MTTLPPGFSDNTLKIYLTIRQYPLLRNRIRERMRKEHSLADALRRLVVRALELRA